MGGMNMTFEELIEKYRKRINSSIDKKVETEKIIKEIDSLTYSSNDKPISNADKRKLLTGLRKEILDETVLVYSQDNKDYLDLINQTIKMLEGK